MEMVFKSIVHHNEVLNRLNDLDIIVKGVIDWSKKKGYLC